MTWQFVALVLGLAWAGVAVLKLAVVQAESDRNHKRYMAQCDDEEDGEGDG